jgi:hypothetical protein
MISAEDEIGRELTKIAEDPESFVEELKWTRRQRGDLVYELEMVGPLAAIESGKAHQ